MFAHDLNAFSYCVNLSASKRNVSELATSSSHPSDSSIAFPKCVLSALHSWEMQFATHAMGSSASSVETVVGTSASTDNAGWSPQA